jgi:hypothetical protein
MTFASHMPFPIGKQEIPQIGGQFVPPSFKQEISVGPYTGGIGDGFGEIGTYKGGATVEPLDFLGGFMKDHNLADLSDYRKRWINHTSGKDVITDPFYRKELQDIILYPDRFGFNPRV